MKRKVFSILLAASIWFVAMIILFYKRHADDMSIWIYILTAIVALLFGYTSTRSIDKRLSKIVKKRVEEVKGMDFGEDVVCCGAMSYFRWKSFLFFADGGVGVLLKNKFLFIRYNLRSHETLLEIPFSDIKDVSDLDASKRFTLFLKSGEEKRFMIDDDNFYRELKQLVC